MKLTRIRVEQFRQFREPLLIDALQPGINLFSGPNEAGKSTIVAAIRAAFFERHRSSSVDDFRPWGDSTASPGVELDFTVAGADYRLRKRFLGKKRCDLHTGTLQLDGAAAEDHLAALLGFGYAGRGASSAEHWGIPGLLWIQQGAAHDIGVPVGHATDHLRGALNESLGEIASSGGDEVLASVESMRNELLTPAAGTPRGSYAEALKKAAGLEASLQELDGEIGNYRHKVDALATLRREHAADAHEQPWANFRAQQKDALDKLAATQRLQSTLATDQQRAAQLAGQIKLLRGQVQSFVKQEEDLAARAAATRQAAQALAGATALASQWAARGEQAGRAHEAARVSLRMARQEDTRRSLAAQRDELRQKAETAGAALARAEQEQAALLTLQQQAAASELASADLTLLRDQQRQIRELQIRQQAAATRLRFVLDDGARIELGTERVVGQTERLVFEPTSLLLPGLGRLDISPGGTDLADLRRNEHELADRHTALLQRCGLASLEAAETRHLSHSQWLAQIKTAAATVKALAPKGLEALRSEHAGQHARAADIEQALAQLPPPGASAAGLTTVAQAEAAEEAARAALEKIRQSLNEAQLAAGQGQARFDAAAREQASAQAVVDAPERALQRAAAQQALVDAGAEQAIVGARIEALAAQVKEARPELLQQDAQRFGQSAEQLHKQFSERQTLLMRLEVELESAGAQGLDERRAELARDAAQAARRAGELRRRAAALDHLLTVLRAHRGALTRKLQAPLQKHLNRYVQLLFPHASLEIDPNLAPGALMRHDARGPQSGAFEALSFGAREQMGVICRLAYADLLREAGRPTLIILDDALVHSDDERLALMKRVLFDAATRHQILLFTCHPLNWRDLGVTARSVAALASGGVGPG